MILMDSDDSPTPKAPAVDYGADARRVRDFESYVNDLLRAAEGDARLLAGNSLLLELEQRRRELRMRCAGATDGYRTDDDIRAIAKRAEARLEELRPAAAPLDADSAAGRLKEACEDIARTVALEHREKAMLDAFRAMAENASPEVAAALQQVVGAALRENQRLGGLAALTPGHRIAAAQADDLVRNRPAQTV
jgi:hypothetical protein